MYLCLRLFFADHTSKTSRKFQKSSYAIEAAEKKVFAEDDLQGYLLGATTHCLLDVALPAGDSRKNCDGKQSRDWPKQVL